MNSDLKPFAWVAFAALLIYGFFSLGMKLQEQEHRHNMETRQQLIDSSHNALPVQR